MRLLLIILLAAITSCAEKPQVTVDYQVAEARLADFPVPKFQPAGKMGTWVKATGEFMLPVVIHRRGYPFLFECPADSQTQSAMKPGDVFNVKLAYTRYGDGSEEIKCEGVL
jgi:hypothetical protein